MVEHLHMVMPVPLHRTRLRARGFNQSLVLARQVSETFSLPLDFNNLVRLRATRPQVELNGRERAENVAGAFQLRSPADIQQKRVLLVDDVLTTGATMNECAKTLKEAGAEAVISLTIARPMEEAL